MLNSLIQGGKAQGMQTMDDALFALVKQGVIRGSDAYMKATDKARFESLSGADEQSRRSEPAQPSWRYRTRPRGPLPFAHQARLSRARDRADSGACLAIARVRCALAIAFLAGDALLSRAAARARPGLARARARRSASPRSRCSRP